MRDIVTSGSRVYRTTASVTLGSGSPSRAGARDRLGRALPAAQTRTRDSGSWLRRSTRSGGLRRLSAASARRCGVAGIGEPAQRRRRKTGMGDRRSARPGAAAVSGPPGVGSGRRGGARPGSGVRGDPGRSRVGHGVRGKRRAARNAAAEGGMRAVQVAQKQVDVVEAIDEPVHRVQASAGHGRIAAHSSGPTSGRIATRLRTVAETSSASNARVDAGRVGSAATAARTRGSGWPTNSAALAASATSSGVTSANRRADAGSASSARRTSGGAMARYVQREVAARGLVRSGFERGPTGRRERTPALQQARSDEPVAVPGRQLGQVVGEMGDDGEDPAYPRIEVDRQASVDGVREFGNVTESADSSDSSEARLDARAADCRIRVGAQGDPNLHGQVGSIEQPLTHGRIGMAEQPPYHCLGQPGTPPRETSVGTSSLSANHPDKASGVCGSTANIAANRAHRSPDRSTRPQPSTPEPQPSRSPSVHHELPLFMGQLPREAGQLRYRAAQPHDRHTRPAEGGTRRMASLSALGGNTTHSPTT